MAERDGRERRGLRVVPPAQGRRIAGVEIAVAPPERPPFPVSAVAIEDDTFSVLGAGTTAELRTEHPIRLWTALKNLVEAEPGSVVVRPGRPLRLLAVVHDLSCDPTWREEWIARALAGVLREIERRGLESLGLPPLGAVHGKLAPARFAELLAAALTGARPRSLERIWIVSADGRALPCPPDTPRL